MKFVRITSVRTIVSVVADMIESVACVATSTSALMTQPAPRTTTVLTLMGMVVITLSS